MKNSVYFRMASSRAERGHWPLCVWTAASLLSISCASATTPEVAMPPVQLSTAVTQPVPAAVTSLSTFTKPVALMPRAVTSFGAAASATHLYTLGGYFGIAHQYSKESVSADFQRMDLQTGQWETLPSGGAVQSATLTEFEGRLYRTGGLRIDNAKGEPEALQSLRTFEVFDPRLARWETLTPLPAERSSHEAVMVGSVLYLIGGWQLSGGAASGRFDDAMFAADLKASPIVWRSLPIPFRLRALGVAAIGNRIVTVGGIDDNAASKAVHLFDTVSGSWSSGPEFPEPGFGVRAATLADTVFASGQSGNVYRFEGNGSDARWERATTLTFPRVFHQFVATSNARGLVLGGIPGMRGADRVRHIEEVTLGEARGRISHWEVAAPGAAKNRQGIFLRKDQLYVFGGNNSLGQHDFGKENFVATAHRLDLGSLSWKPLPAFPEPRQSMQTIEAKSGSAYVIGGFGLQGGKQVTTDEVYRFDFENESWSKAPRGLSDPRTQFGLAEHGQRLWLFGGLNFDSSRSGKAQFVHPRSVLTLNLEKPDEGFSAAGFDTPRERRAFASALLGDKYYIVGGMAEGFNLVPGCDVYDFATQTWSTIPAPQRTRLGAEMVALSGKLYLAAGRSKGADDKLGPDNSIEVFDPEAGSWSMLLDGLPMEDTHQMRMLPFGSRLLIYTAQRSDGNIQLLVVDPN